MIAAEVVMARREKGTGMKPRLRADGRWEARWTDPSGKRRYVYSRTAGRAGEREVGKLRDEAIRASDAGLRPSEQPLAAYVARWIVRHPKLSPQSRQRYADLVRLHLEPTEQGRIPVVRLQPEHVEDLYRDRIDSGMAPKSVELLHTVLSGALRQAARRGHTVRDALVDVSPPPVPKKKRPVFSRDEVRRMLDVGDRLTALWTLAYAVPIREGELLALTWVDLDLERARMVLEHPEKSGVPRTLLLPSPAVRALRGHRARQAEERLASGGAYEELGLVFAGLDGNRLDPRRMREAFARVLTAAGCQKLRFHDLRHTAITHLLEDGVPLKVVQEIAGHRSPRTTIEVYAHATETMGQIAVEAMERILA